MRRAFLVALTLCMFTSLALAQEPASEPTQDPNVPFRLFSTKNIYTFLRLDTRDGRLWQVQWGDKDHRFNDVLNSTALVSGGRLGRFTLYPTSNIYTFILLDQETGDAWQIQWGKPDDRFIVYIE
jgi:hypothetical protein